jgi:putative membrane-bound dehydrogenase-like protein
MLMNVKRICACALALVSVRFAAPTMASDATRAADAPVPAAQAPGRMTVPEGFHVTLVAGEPDVRQPIAFAFDDRGRLWVAECFSYPAWKPEGNDRVLILEDSDGDGRFDRRTIFYDKVANISGIEVGFGGVWVCAIPNLLFIPDRDGDDRPDGPPAAVLDGWDVKAQHNVVNGLKWGPDGWLYGCNGILSNSKVGRPGTPDAERVALNCGVWRYHPTSKDFEVVASGTTNPWGLDFDDYGEMFITNCVIPHLFHVVPGAHFQRMYGLDLNPYVYGLMESCADHIHWAGGAWQDSRGGKGKHGEAGGGHAHAGAMIYLGDNWPDRYRNSVFTCNIHGHRVNHDSLHRSGSGYVARHEKDFLFANDEWFRGLELKYGPDGAVYLTDWSDTGECHENDADGAHRENGRIFKVSFGKPAPARVNLAGLDDAALVRLQLHKNDWYVRHARRLLQERAAAGRDMTGAHRALKDLFDGQDIDSRKLRALWALYAVGGLTSNDLIGLLDHASEHVRAWAVRLLVDRKAAPPAALAKFAAMAKDEPSPLVRVHLASALQRVALEARWAIAEPLAARAQDARDQNLPLMIWYGIEPLVGSDATRAVGLAARCAIPLVRNHLARRVVAAGADSPGVVALVALIGRTSDPAAQRDLLEGMHETLRGRKRVETPDGWPSAFARIVKSSDPGVKRQALVLALLFGDPKAAEILRATVEDTNGPPDERRGALQALVEKRVPGLAPMLQSLIDDRAMRGPVIRALAAYADGATPRLILRRYGSLNDNERADAVNTLASRPSDALALLDAVERGVVPRRDLTAFTARQLLAFADPKITRRLEKVWGTVRPTSTEKSALVAKYKSALTPDRLKGADLSNGRLVFNRTCVQCHKLYGVGGDVGPDLTGSDRATLDYVLENVLDPSAAVARDYTLTNVATRDGRLIFGLLREQTERTLTVQTVNERVVLDREDVEEIKPSPASMMPEGILDKLSPDDVRDLVAYLASKSQVPLPPEKAAAGADSAK